MGGRGRTGSQRLAFDVCAFCDAVTWCYQTGEAPTCRGCHIVAYFAAVLFEPIGLQLLPWQEKFLREVYGTVELETGRRRFWKAYAEVPGKNGKSFLIGGLPLYHLDAEGVERAQAFGCAAAKEQAGIVYRSAAHLVRENPDPEFRRRFKINESTYRIIHRPTSGYYRVISADGKLNDGEEPSLAIFDELHRWSTQKAQTLYHVMNKGTVSRLDSMIIEITTAGGKDESPICWAEHERARRILDGNEPRGKMYAVIYGADEERHKKEPEYWQSREARVQANPSHEDNGGFLADDKIGEQMETLGKGPFLRYHLNLWAQKQERWLDSGEWERGAVVLRPLTGRSCYIGLDLSSTTDFTAMALLFPDDSDASYDVLSFFWLPAKRVPDLARRLHVPLERWIDDGLIEATQGDYVDYQAVEDKIAWATERHAVQEICYDPWNATDLINRLDKTGYTCVKVPQTIVHISAPMKHLHRKILAGQIRHGGNEVLAWHANSVVARYDGNGNIAPRKPDLGKDSHRIDGFCALLTALSRGMIDEDQWADVGVSSVCA